MENNKNVMQNKLYSPSTSVSAQTLESATSKDCSSQFIANLLAEALEEKTEQTIMEPKKQIMQCHLNESYDEVANRYHVEQIVDQIMYAYMYTPEISNCSSAEISNSSSSSTMQDNMHWGYNSAYQMQSVINLYDEEPGVSGIKRGAIAKKPSTTREDPSPVSSIRSIGSTVCRICHNAENPERLVSPCLCKGTLTYVHEQCLKRWIATSGSTKCELCQYQYNTEQTLRYTCFQSLRLWYSRGVSRRALQTDCQMLSLLTLVAFGIIGTLLVGMQYYFTSETVLFGISQLWTKTWLLICLFITLTVYLVNVYIILKQQLIPWYRWWQSARNIVLVLENHNRFTLHAARRSANRPLLADVPLCSDITEINAENTMHNNNTDGTEQQTIRNQPMIENGGFSFASLFQHMSLIETQREVPIVIQSINSTQTNKLDDRDNLDFAAIYFDPLDLI